MLASILRLNVTHSSPENPYTIPEDNPFVDDDDARSEIYAYAFRQPWRASQDIGDANTGM